MKYILGILLIVIGAYLFWSIRNGGLPDIKDIEDVWDSDIQNNFREKYKDVQDD